VKYVVTYSYLMTHEVIVEAKDEDEACDNVTHLAPHIIEDIVEIKPMKESA
jgi:hypothetical protein